MSRPTVSDAPLPPETSGSPAAEVQPPAARSNPCQRLSVLNRLLDISVENLSLEEQLDRSLTAILSIPWLTVEPKGGIFLADEKERTLRLVAHVGFDECVVGRCATVPFGRCVCGGAAARREPVFLDFGAATPPDARCEVPAGHYSLPIRARDRLLGVLSVYVEPGYRRRGDDDAFLVSVTHVLAAMIEHRQTEARTHTLIEINRATTQHLILLQEEEYRQLARELHDELGQAVAAIRTDAALILRHSAGREDAVGRSAEAIKEAADRLHEITHAMMRRLRPSVLDDLGLAAALETMVADWRARRPGLPCRLSLEGDVDGLGEEADITVFRLVQEGLTNVLRHAAASHVHVAVTCRRPQADLVEVLIEDDGRGMDLDGRLRSGRRFGLLGMRERVEGLGGRLEIDSAPGRGLRLCATIPLMSEPARR